MEQDEWEVERESDLDKGAGFSGLEGDPEATVVWEVSGDVCLREESVEYRTKHSRHVQGAWKGGL